jgi:predicted Rossmann fold nucleotide-binding protein DprA/Smf involved in DNA uptake
LVAGLADALLVLSAPPGSATLKLAKAVLRQGKAVFTPDHHTNQELLGCDALPATLQNIQTVLG